MISVSICIPNYNKSNELLELLYSIELSIKNSENSEYRAVPEIIICDNNSSDGVCEKVKYFSGRSFLNIKYFRQHTNIGFQKNLLKAIELSSGNYIWLMGSDDAITPEAWTKLSKDIYTNKYDVLIYNRLLCDPFLNQCKPDQYVNIQNNTLKTEFDSAMPNLVKYINSSLTVDALGCFISTLIFSEAVKTKLMVVASDLNRDYSINNWPHVMVLWKLLDSDSSYTIAYDSTPIVKWRSGNSSFSLNEFSKYCDLLCIAKSMEHIELSEAIVWLASKQYDVHIPRHFLHIANCQPVEARRLKVYREIGIKHISLIWFYPAMYRVLRYLNTYKNLDFSAECSLHYRIKRTIGKRLFAVIKKFHY